MAPLGNKGTSDFSCPESLSDLSGDPRVAWRRWGVARRNNAPSAIRYCSTRALEIPDDTRAPCGAIRIERAEREDGRVSVSYPEMLTCDRHACPHCRSRWVWSRARDIVPLLKGWGDAGGRVLHVTLTIRHDAGLALDILLEVLADAWRRFALAAFRGASKRQPATAPYLAGRSMLRVLQVTHGESGWHPHYHLIAWWTPDRSAASIREDIQSAWIKAVRHVTRRSPKLQKRVEPLEGPACEVTIQGPKTEQPAPGKLGWYVLGALELLCDDTKDGGGGADPLELLDDPDTAHLWAEYASAIEGKRLVSWAGRRRAKSALLEDLEGMGVELEERDPPEPAHTSELRVSYRGWRWLLSGVQTARICAFLAAVRLSADHGLAWWSHHAPVELRDGEHCYRAPEAQGDRYGPSQGTKRTHSRSDHPPDGDGRASTRYGDDQPTPPSRDAARSAHRAAPSAGGTAGHSIDDGRRALRRDAAAHLHHRTYRLDGARHHRTAP